MSLLIDHGDLQGLSDDDHTQYLLVDGTRAMSGALQMGDNNISGINNILFTDVNGQIAGIENQNLLDKTASETITGDWTFNGDNDYTGNHFEYSSTITETGTHHYMEVIPTLAPSAAHTGTFNGLKVYPSSSGSRAINNMQGAQIGVFHGIDYVCLNLYGIRCNLTVGGVFSDGPGWCANGIAGEFNAFHRSNSATQSTNLEGGRFITDLRGTNDCVNVITGNFQMKKSGTSIATNYIGLQLDSSFITAGTITNLTGLYIKDLSGCTITNAPSAISIANQSESGARGIKLGSMTYCFEFPTDTTGNTSAATGRVPVYHNGGIKYLRLYDD